LSGDNKTIARRYYEELWGGKPGAADEIFAQEVTSNALWENPVDTVTGAPVAGAQKSSPGDEKANVAVWRENLNDLNVTVDQMMEDGDKVIALYAIRANNPRRGPMTVRGMDVFRFANGKIVEYWSSWDRLGFWQQMGVVGPTGELRAKAGITLSAQS
jgi:ketosteroid isomerase-like protein